MSFTSRLGTADSRFGNVILGDGSPSVVHEEPASDVITFSDVMSGWNLTQSISDTLTLTDEMSAFKVGGLATDTLTFSETLSFAGSVLSGNATDTLTFVDSAGRNQTGEAEDELTFTDEAVGALSFEREAEDTFGPFSETVATENILNFHKVDPLEFVEVISRTMIRVRELSDTLTLDETIVGNLVKPIADTLSLADSFTVFLAKLVRDELDFDSIFYVTTILNRALFDVFEMYDSIFLNTLLRLPITDTLVFTDTMTGAVVRPTSDTLTFLDLGTGVATKYMNDVLTLDEIFTVTKVKNVSTTDTLTFAEVRSVSLVLERLIEDTVTFIEAYTGIRVKFGTATDSFEFTDELYREVHVVTAPDSLTFSDALDYQKIGVGTATDTLSLADSIFVNTVISRTLTDTLLFQEKRPADNQPPSAIGLPDTPSGTYGTVADKMMVFIGQTLSVVIAPPEFNDYAADRNQVIFKKKMDATVTTFIKTCKDEKLHYEFIVPRPKALEFRAFLDAENGRAFTIYDWKGQVWVAKLLTDTIDTEEVGRWEPCGNKTRISVEFLGRRYA